MGKTNLINAWQQAIDDKISIKQLEAELKQSRPSLTSVAFTRECVLNCQHCVYPQANCRDIQLNDLDRIDKAIDATFKAGNRDLIHVGRILKKEHLPILKKYQDRGMSLNLIDNGSGQWHLADIKDLGVFFDGGIDISIDGNRESHEAQRGAGAWQLALSGIESLRAAASQICVTGTASTLNYDTIVDGLLDVKKRFSFIKLLQITTTSPTKFQIQRMHLNREEMTALLHTLIKISNRQAFNLVIYRTEDLQVIVEELMKYGRPNPKYIHLEWKINNLTVAYFPESIVPAEEFAIDANGLHVLPFGLDHHLDERPDEWEMRDKLILSDPDKSYERLVEKYYKIRGREKLNKEKEIFSKYKI